MSKTRGGKRAGAGRPPISYLAQKREPRDHLKELYDLIPVAGFITASKFKEKAGEKGISSETLYNKLEDLQKSGMVLRWIDTSDKIPRVCYTRREFFELGPQPTTDEEKKQVIQTTKRFRDAISYGKALVFWESILAECEKEEPGKFTIPLSKIKSEATDLLRTDLTITALGAALIMRRLTKAENENERKDIIKIASKIYIHPLMLEFATSPNFVPNPDIWDNVAHSFYETISESITDKKLASFRKAINDAYDAIKSSEKAKLIAGKFVAKRFEHLEKMWEDLEKKYPELTKGAKRRLAKSQRKRKRKEVG